MNKKTLGLLVASILILSVFVNAVSAIQIRPMNQMSHPGINHPFVSWHGSYSNFWNGISRLCDNDNQIRPANQGYNIPKFYSCSWED